MFRGFLLILPPKTINQIVMDKKFPYGHDVDKYLEQVSPGPFYVGRNDLENCPGLKEFLGFK